MTSIGSNRDRDTVRPGEQTTQTSLAVPIRLAIVGCGAVVEQFHLPAARRVPEVEIVALADPDLERARELSRRFGIPKAVADYRETLEEADAFLLATPPHLHRPIGERVLRHGKPLLCEKPLAPTAGEAEALVRAAREGKTILAAGHNRRFAWNLEALRELLRGGGLGQVTALRAEDGFPFNWPARTAYAFMRTRSGGVLMENGVHILDTLQWLLGEARVEDYRDDALGGVESNARLSLRFADGAIGEVWVTRTCEAGNFLRLESTDGWAEAPLYDHNRLTFEARRSKAGRTMGPVTIVAPFPQDYVSLMAAQLADFAASICQGRPPRATGDEAVRTISWIERAYALKAGRPLPEQAPLPGETW